MNKKDKDTTKDSPTLRMKFPMLNLRADSKSVIEEARRITAIENKRSYDEMIAYICGSRDYIYDDYDDYDEYGYGDTGFGLSDEEWAEMQADAYERDIKRFEEISGIPMRGDSVVSKKKKGFKSQKYINGIEVSDEEFEKYQKKTNTRVTRRGGRKHKNRNIRNVHGTEIISSANKRSTRYVDDDWWDEHDNDRESLCDELKDITFYRNLPDTSDVYMFTNLLEFDNWLQENDIRVEYEYAQELMYDSESHCCIDPFRETKNLMVARSYDDLVFNVTGGDTDMLNDEENVWNYHGV